jgi:Lrp/AsnC family leucine-responsive transcriptional regulator
MPLQLDNYDILILKSLLKDGRKSFREISRETGITTPTVKARFSRLVNVGFIKSVSPVFDFDIVERENILKPTLEDEQNKVSMDSKTKEDENRKNNNDNSRINPQQGGRLKIKKGLKIKLDCEFCKGPITSHPHVLRFANYERFFCCTGCMSGYKQKYAGRIESIKRKFAEIE